MGNKQILQGLLKGSLATGKDCGTVTGLLTGLVTGSLLTGGLLTGGLLGVVPAATAQSTQPSVRANAAIDPQQVPTVRYGRGEAVDLSLIVEEWRDRYPDIPVYVCSCNAETCGNPENWPYREFTQYQSMVALGPINAGRNQATGFNCFDMETGEQP